MERVIIQYMHRHTAYAEEMHLDCPMSMEM